MERIADHHIVFHGAEEALAVLDAAVQGQVVIEVIVARSVVEIDVPAVVAAPAAVTKDVGFHHVGQRKVAVRSRGDCVQVDIFQTPIAVASPGIERSVITRFFHRIEDIAELYDVPAPRAFRYVDAGARRVVDGAVTHGDAARHGNLHAGGLLLDATREIDQAVVY
jgi:hypothetical protein